MASSSPSGRGARRALFGLALLLGALAIGARAAGLQDKPAAGAEPQKSIEVIDASRYTALVAQQHGKPLMVTFWATWCEPCRDEYPMVNELVKQYKPKGLEVFAVSLDDDAEETLALHFIAKNQPVFTNYRKKPGKEEEFINQVDVKWTGALPATFFYDREGHVAGQLVGEHTRQQFVAELDKLVAAAAKN